MLIAESEGANFWLSVRTEQQHRSVEYILIACVDGLKGFHDEIDTMSPQTNVRLCIVHMVRNSLKYVSWKLPKHLHIIIDTDNLEE
jgi:putative transposase